MAIIRVGCPQILYLHPAMLFKNKYSLVLFTFLLPFAVAGQDLTGIWKGYFITEDLNQYKVEFQIKQTKSSITGVSYSYLTTIYYGKATMNGGWEKESKSLKIQELKTIEVKANEGSVSCLMNYYLSYSKSGREEYLEGNFTSKHEYSAGDIKKGADCGGGRVYLRRVSSSDFYTEPFLQNTASKKVIVNQAPLSRKVSSQVSASDKDKTNNESALSSAPTQDRIVAENKIKNAQQEPLVIPAVINNRFNDLVQVVTVKNPHVQISLFDNGEIDGDTVTVYLNNKLVLNKKRLSTIPLTVNLVLEQDNKIQELTIVAENLGVIPPNTALMIVEAGGEQFRIMLASSEQKNAVVRFRYEK
ncbi:MAG: hypothetical protein FJY19_04185 [Bacteroidetes bacterium]|nr:hypothetical protein [Bacteroidota bacterium]